MAAKEAAARVRGAIDTLKTTNVKERPLVEVLELSHQLADAMKYFFGSLDQSIMGEFKDIAEFIRTARDEISALRPNDIRNERLPTAGAELDAVVRDTEQATDSIMSHAEEVMCAEPGNDPAAYKALVDERMLDIIEACSFQDLTGQRVSKVVSTLTHIEERVTAFAAAMGVQDAATEESEEDRRKRELLLNGPAMDGPETDQADIDAMFADAPAAVSQDDIDAMFD